MTQTLASPLPVMLNAQAQMLDVAVHASVLALIEAYEKATDRRIAWATLLAGASAWEDPSLAAVTPDAVTDLLSLRLVDAGTTGLGITAAGGEVVRGWNGAYRERLQAALELLERAGLIATRS